MTTVHGMIGYHRCAWGPCDEPVRVVRGRNQWCCAMHRRMTLSWRQRAVTRPARKRLIYGERMRRVACAWGPCSHEWLTRQASATFCCLGHSRLDRYHRRGRTCKVRRRCAWCGETIPPGHGRRYTCGYACRRLRSQSLQRLSATSPTVTLWSCQQALRELLIAAGYDGLPRAEALRRLGAKGYTASQIRQAAARERPIPLRTLGDDFAWRSTATWVLRRS